MSKQAGNIAENAAISTLIDNGYKILFRNYYCRFGEIDIIAEEKDVIVFVEVKQRSGAGFGGAISAITQHKIDKIIKTATIYLQENKLSNVDWRIDAVLLEGVKAPEIMKNIYTEGF
ncbi:MAG: YraN family protein [bacterium]